MVSWVICRYPDASVNVLKPVMMIQLYRIDIVRVSLKNKKAGERVLLEKLESIRFNQAI